MVTNETETGRPPEYLDALVDFSDGELPADERAMLASHVATCPGCRTELSRLDASLRSLATGIAVPRGRGSGRALAAPTESGSAGASPSQYRLGAMVGFSWPDLSDKVVWWTAQRPNKISEADQSTVVAGPKLSQHDALWQIALIEQQARLQTSLDLLPGDALSTDEREETQAIVERLDSATYRWRRFFMRQLAFYLCCFGLFLAAAIATTAMAEDRWDARVGPAATAAMLLDQRFKPADGAEKVAEELEKTYADERAGSAADSQLVYEVVVEDKPQKTKLFR